MLRIVYTVHWIQPNKLLTVSKNVNILILYSKKAAAQTQTEVKNAHDDCKHHNLFTICGKYGFISTNNGNRYTAVDKYTYLP